MPMVRGRTLGGGTCRVPSAARGGEALLQLQPKAAWRVGAGVLGFSRWSSPAEGGAGSPAGRTRIARGPPLEARGPGDLTAHNDLLAVVSLLDDGRAAMWLIDWDYAGSAAFLTWPTCLADNLGPAGRRALLRTIFGASLPTRLPARVRRAPSGGGRGCCRAPCPAHNDLLVRFRRFHRRLASAGAPRDGSGTTPASTPPPAAGRRRANLPAGHAPGRSCSPGPGSAPAPVSQLSPAGAMRHRSLQFGNGVASGRHPRSHSPAGNRSWGAVGFRGAVALRGSGARGSGHERRSDRRTKDPLNQFRCVLPYPGAAGTSRATRAIAQRRAASDEAACRSVGLRCRDGLHQCCASTIPLIEDIGCRGAAASSG